MERANASVVGGMSSNTLELPVWEFQSGSLTGQTRLKRRSGVLHSRASQWSMLAVALLVTMVAIGLWWLKRGPVEVEKEEATAEPSLGSPPSTACLNADVGLTKTSHRENTSNPGFSGLGHDGDGLEHAMEEGEEEEEEEYDEDVAASASLLGRCD